MARLYQDFFSLRIFMPQKHRTLLSLALGLALASSMGSILAAEANAAAVPKGITTGASVEGIQEYRLANGMKVLLFPDASKPTTTVNITYLVGSMHENYGETGMAHLLEHLVFKGTPSNKDITAEFKRRGISFNGTTYFDRTNYYGTFSADQAQLEWLLNLEADRMINSFIARKDLDSEMTVVRNEMEAGETQPFSVLLQRLRSTAYLWHNYGNDTIGARSDVENVNIERLQAFYRTYYQPDNAVLVVAGKFDSVKTLAAIQKSYGAIKKPARSLPSIYTREPTQDGERSVIVRRVGDTTAVGLAYHIPAVSHADNAALNVLSLVMSDTPSGRLHKTFVETKKAAFAAQFSQAFSESGLALGIAMLPKGADHEAFAKELIAQLEQIKDKPVTEDEVNRAKAKFNISFEQALNNPQATAINLSESIASGDWRLSFLGRDRIQAVTAADVNRVAQTYLKPSNRTLGYFIPDAKPDRSDIPAIPNVAEMVKDYKGKAAIAAGESFDTSPLNIESRTTRFTLSNGMKVAFLPKKTRGEEVHFEMGMSFGDGESLNGRGDAGSSLGGMLIRGTKTLSREQIDQRTTELKADVSVSGSATSASANGKTTKNNLLGTLRLVADVLKNPSLPASEFEQMRNQMLISIESSKSEPQSLASELIGKHFDKWPAGHPLKARSIEEGITAIKQQKLEELAAFHRDFYGTNNAEIGIVGDFDPVAVKAELETLFGNWNSTKKFTRIDKPFYKPAALDVEIKTPDKANAFLLMLSPIAVGQQHPDYAAIAVGNYILGGGTLKSRLADRIRQKDGLSYGVGSNFSAEYFNDYAMLAGYAIAAPENSRKVEAAMREEIALLLEKGVSDVELKDAVDGIIKSRAIARANDDGLAGRLQADLLYGRTMKMAQEYEDELKAITVVKVNETLRKHLKPDNLNFVIAGDFDAAAKKMTEKK
jgi:zinc protease